MYHDLIGHLLEVVWLEDDERNRFKRTRCSSVEKEAEFAYVLYGQHFQGQELLRLLILRLEEEGELMRLLSARATCLVHVAIASSTYLTEDDVVLFRVSLGCGHRLTIF